LTYDAAEPLEVEIIVNMLAAIAYLTRTPRYTSRGIIILPPPRPVKEPIKPAGIEMRNMVIISITVVTSLSVTDVNE
jgi:hypothetical protein